MELGLRKRGGSRSSEAYLSRKMKLLGHVIRTGNEDPMRQVTFKEGCIKELKVGTMRVGKPKLDWLRQGKSQVWKQKSGQTSTNRIGQIRKGGESIRVSWSRTLRLLDGLWTRSSERQTMKAGVA